MSDDYLWDGKGPPDPEVERLERLLARYRHVPRPQPEAASWRFPTAAVVRSLAAAVVIVIVGLAAMVAFRLQWASGAPWEITRVGGSPRLAGQPLRGDARLGVGDALETDARSNVTVRIARVGEVEIGPNSELELLATGRGRHRVSLQRGSLEARLFAPPFTFGVRTPAGLASDVGCAFRLEYEGGRGVLRVLSGWVDFENTMVPAGAVAELREGEGAGSPHYPDATEDFRAALREVDFGVGRAALPRVLSTARSRDAMTLLHLVEHAPPGDRSRIYDRLVELAPPPPGITRDGILAADAEQLRAWRAAIGLKPAKRWWLNWRDAL